jgi:hypothetical protein
MKCDLKTVCQAEHQLVSSLCNLGSMCYNEAAVREGSGISPAFWTIALEVPSKSLRQCAQVADAAQLPNAKLRIEPIRWRDIRESLAGM